MKRILLGFLTAIILIISLGLTTNHVITKVVNKLVVEKVSTLLFNRFDFLSVLFHPSQFRLNGLGFSDTVLRINLVRNVVTVGVGSMRGSISLHFIYFILLVIPMLALSVGGFLSSKLSRPSTRREVIQIGIGIGILYSLFLGLISPYGTVVSTILIPLTKEGIRITSTFSFVDALFHGFLLGFVFSSLGAWIQIRMASKCITEI